MSNPWKEAVENKPPEGLPVEVKIDDADGCRNQSVLVYKRRMWWYPDMTMYVYFTPTHWRMLDRTVANG